MECHSVKGEKVERRGSVERMEGMYEMEDKCNT